MSYDVFMGENYYPSGGWNDYVASFQTERKARNFIVKTVTAQYKKSKFQIPEWGHIVFEKKIVWSGYDLHKIARDTIEADVV